ncbi:microspherule protein 1-like [Tubulanus polymorphus]|uniref:microspherule protein 1-like n=1 Tax=Tubulanus polymorphus TaxID=672921 RepID=UPI003DA1D197
MDSNNANFVTPTVIPGPGPIPKNIGKRPPPTAISAPVERRRSSQRSIKRKKFDDEVVESSLIKSEPKKFVKPEGPVQVEGVPPPPPEKKKLKSKSKKSKKRKRATADAPNKDLGRWKPQDDLALITAVQQTCDLKAVHLGIKFTCKFTLKEVQERWYILLYDPVLSKLALNAMYQLHPDNVAAIQARTLFSKEEEDILKTIISVNSQPTVDVFQELLQKHPTVFHYARTAKALYNHWLLLKQYHLLPDQSVQPMPKGDHVLNFSDAEDLLNDEDLKDPADVIMEQELSIADRKNKKEIRTLEQEIPKWQVLVDSVTGISPPDFDNQTLAVLRGRLVRYLMRSKEITLGRATKDNLVDVDLTLEGPAWKISRRQGVIKLRNNGEFFVANEGKRPVYIDGKPVLSGTKQKLNNNSVVEMSGLRFIFLVNQDLINALKSEAQRNT